MYNYYVNILIEKVKAQTADNCDANGIELTDPDANNCLCGFFTRFLNRFRSFINILKILFFG